jgi:hypothetical protein
MGHGVGCYLRPPGNAIADSKQVEVSLLAFEEDLVDVAAESVLVVSGRAGVVERASIIAAKQRLTLLLKGVKENQVGRGITYRGLVQNNPRYVRVQRWPIVS